MSKKDKSQRGSSGGKQPAAPKEEPFFRPFSKLPRAAPKPEAPPARPADPKAKSPARSPAASAPAPSRSPAPAPPPRRGAQPEDDSLTFERFMSGVTPLDPFAVRRIPASSEDPGAPSVGRVLQRSEVKAADDAAREKLRALVEDGSRFEVTDDGRRIEGRRRGVDGGLVRKLRMGELTVDARLDVQGMRGDEARERVESFVRDRRVRGDRVVVITYGKPRAARGSGSVLRGEVAAWLGEGNASTHISAFVTAPDELGGEGAMCVLLSSTREEPRRL